MKIGVIGGGISGIRAALTLARAGVDVTLFEKNRFLGGRVFSFQTPDFGEVDIGQHIWLRACTAVEELLRDLAVPDDWIYRQERVAMTYRYPDGDVRFLAGGRLPGRLGGLPVLLGARLSLMDKLRYAWASVRANWYSAEQLEKLDQISIAHWLRDHGQTPAIVQLFWEPFLVSVCNARLPDVSARHGLFAMRESLFKSATASAICTFRRPLSEFFDRQARKVLAQLGAKVELGAQVLEVRPGSSAIVRDRSGAEQSFDKVILATPPRRLRGLLPGVTLPEPPEEGAIAGLLLRYARPVMDELFFAAVGSPVQFVFNKTAVWNRPSADGSQILEFVISAAEREVKLGVERLSAELLPELAKLLPRTTSTPLLAKRMLVHGTSTFRVKLGGETRRKELAQLRLANVYIAGEYADTGWPSTMESAARAGQTAAHDALGKLA